MPGPLEGFRIIELAGIGPGPFAGMLLADMGAEVIAVERAGAGAGMVAKDMFRRGKRFIALDLKTEDGCAVVHKLAAGADALFEGFRPGVTERLGLGPDTLLSANPRLVYGRMTGWGQSGPLAERAGHDINYIAVAGALHPMGPADGPPTVPLNLVGDFGGGAMFLVAGMLAAMLSAQKTGRGQVVDAAMVDGTNVLMTLFHSLSASGLWPGGRGENMLDGGAPFYGTYETSDGRYMAVGSIEPQFARLFYAALGLPADTLGQHMAVMDWPVIRAEVAARFREKTQADWCTIFADSDACVTPVVPFTEVAQHPHMAARGAFLEADGLQQPAPAPRFSSTPALPDGKLPAPGADSRPILADLGYTAADIDQLFASGIAA